MRRDALVVGINQYPFLKDTPTSPAKHLTTPAGDAEAIAQLLENYGDFRVKRLPESIIDGKLQVDPKKKVTTEELETAIANLFLPDSDNVPTTALLFFAGHGLREVLETKTQAFLAVSDTNPNRQQLGMSLGTLWNILQSSQVQQQVIWLDCCFAGELLNFRDTELGRQSFGRDRCLIAASRDYEVAYRHLDREHGLLSSALIAGLDPYKYQANEWISNEQLTVVVRQKLDEYYRKERIAQTPQISNHGETIQLILGSSNPLDNFLQVLVQQISNKLPFTANTRKELRNIQNLWNLRNEDIELLYIGLANEFYKQKKLLESIYILKEAILLNNDNIIAHENLAYTLLENGQINDAIVKYDSIRYKSININTHVSFGNILHELNDFSKAIEAYQSAIKFSNNKSVDLPEIYYLLGTVFYDSERFNDAITSYKEAIKIKSYYPEAQAGLAMALYQKQDYIQAYKELQKAIDSQPKNPRFRRYLGIIFAEQGQYKNAIIEFKEAINQNTINNTPDPIVYTHYAFSLLAINQKKEAESEIKLAVELFKRQRMAEAAEQMEHLFQQIKKESSWRNFLRRFFHNT